MGQYQNRSFQIGWRFHEKNKKEAQGDIEKYRHILAANADMVTIQDKVSEFKELWSNASTPSEQNKVYKLMIDRIVYDREDNGITLEVL